MQLNEITVVGNLTKDPEMKYTPSGAGVCTISIGINRTTKVKGSQELKKEVVFINVVVWGKEAEKVAQTVGKGAQVLVMGRLTQDSWEDKTTGQKRSIIKITATHIIPIPREEKQPTEETWLSETE
jgi:single-strand DNA-binding protein